MSCHCRVTGHLPGMSTDLVRKMSWQVCCDRKRSVGGRPGSSLASSSRPLLLIQYILGALFTEAEALVAVMATERKTKPSRMGLPVWLKDLFTHTPEHTCTLYHTHTGMNTHTLALAHGSISRQTLPSYTWPHGHIPINLQSPHFQRASLSPGEPCQSFLRDICFRKEEFGLDLEENLFNPRCSERNRATGGRQIGHCVLAMV